MNSDSPNSQASLNRDKSLFDMLGKILKTPGGNEPNDFAPSQSYPTASNNNLNVRSPGNTLPQDPRIRLQSNHNASLKSETSVWGRMFPESPTTALKSENEVKKEEDDCFRGEEKDELANMMKILQGDSPAKSNTPQLHATSAVPSQPVPPVTSPKEEGEVDESDQPHSFTLLEQRAEYMKKAASLQTKIDMLTQRRRQLRGDGQQTPSMETKIMLKEISKIQLGHQNKLKKINNLIEMVNGIIGERVQDTASTTKATRDIKVSPSKRYNYTFYDPEQHWCRVCNIFPATATDYLAHLHSQDHKAKVAAYSEAPWHGAVGDDSYPTYPHAETKQVPIKGLQFFVPSTAWYCKLCDHFTGDLHCASAHLKSVTHSKNYSIFVKENPRWETEWMIDRQKAYEDMQLNVSLEEVDSFNIEGICGKENGQKVKKKREKRRRSTSSSDSDAESTIQKGKRAKSDSREAEPSANKTSSKRLKPLITDRKILDDVNSTKLPNSLSPPRAYKWDDQRSETRHDDRSMRHDDRSMRYVDRSVRHDDRSLRHDDRSMRHDGRSMRHDYRSMRRDDRSLRRDDRIASLYDRSSRARDIRTPERSRLRSDRERSEARSLRERSEMRSVRERSEVRSERIRIGRQVKSNNETITIDLSSGINSSERNSLVVGKITPFKITSSKREESNALDKEELEKQKEKMAAEIQKKVDEFKEQLMKIQAENQWKKDAAETTPKPATDPDSATHNATPALTAVNATPAPTNFAPTLNANIAHSIQANPAATLPAFIPAMPPTDDLDMNQVVEMANQILRQQALLGGPFGMDPMCMPPLPPMGNSILGPPPGLPIGMTQSLMRMPFIAPLMGGRPRKPTMNIKKKRKPYNPPSPSKENAKQDKKSEDTICPPGEDK